MTKCVDNACEMFEPFNLTEIALRQLFHMYYETEGGDRLLCLGYHNFFICAFGFKAGLFIQYLSFFFLNLHELHLNQVHEGFLFTG